MWNGKTKALTLSYDDGTISDRKLIEILNFYNIKCTFNINSELIGSDYTWDCNGYEVKRLGADGIADLYKGHEIASHGCIHNFPSNLRGGDFDKEFLQDRINLEKMFGIAPVGVAYAFGEYNHDIISRLTSYGFKYGRTGVESLKFDVPQDLMRFNPTCHHANSCVMELVDNFISDKSDTPKLFSLCGHSYEFDAYGGWEHIEKICEKLSGHDDIFYCTNREAFGL